MIDCATTLLSSGISGSIHHIEVKLIPHSMDGLFDSEIKSGIAFELLRITNDEVTTGTISECNDNNDYGYPISEGFPLDYVPAYSYTNMYLGKMLEDDKWSFGLDIGIKGKPYKTEDFKIYGSQTRYPISGSGSPEKYQVIVDVFSGISGTCHMDRMNFFSEGELPYQSNITPSCSGGDTDKFLASFRITDVGIITEGTSLCNRNYQKVDFLTVQKSSSCLDSCKNVFEGFFKEIVGNGVDWYDIDTLNKRCICCLRDDLVSFPFDEFIINPNDLRFYPSLLQFDEYSTNLELEFDIETDNIIQNPVNSTIFITGAHTDSYRGSTSVTTEISAGLTFINPWTVSISSSDIYEHFPVLESQVFDIELLDFNTFTSISGS